MLLRDRPLGTAAAPSFTPPVAPHAVPRGSHAPE